MENEDFKQRINPINALTTLIANKSQITDKNGKIKKKYQRTNIKLPKNKKEKVKYIFYQYQDYNY